MRIQPPSLCNSPAKAPTPPPPPSFCSPMRLSTLLLMLPLIAHSGAVSNSRTAIQDVDESLAEQNRFLRLNGGMPGDEKERLLNFGSYKN
ncbi:secreted RxLR effector peptide protein, putative [Phytophthora infestans T30-4]|uniref:Secreted RxLR effector peptide protein, putative n=1 Tax=Phytophthora infestans (strain T30-4) TaxID=403677 RepID=D0NYM2_PHYIT|nr:secreted RxLR effector peptide protein, putative [Phytophthora infestans T30-4]EEY68644.1 secreted RxLR effector peptide protein, putative [Phytophthora infestans T30-4]|eukprot:XP_002997547.1 secreted RxLR effector peptide protein, putative [Phytophthora infestans T30-4]